MRNHKISVLMSVYNAENTVSRAIESILNQSYKNFEFIIINDGSTDSSKKIIEEYERRDHRIKVITHENIGLTKSLNIGIKISTGSIIARMDADDESHHRRFELQLKQFDYGYDVCACRAKIIPGNIISPRLGWLYPRLKFLFGNPYLHGTLMIKKDSLVKIKNYDEYFKYSQDYKLMYDLILNGAQIKYIRDVLYTRHNLPLCISNAKKNEQKKYGNLIKKLAHKNFLKILFR